MTPNEIIHLPHSHPVRLTNDDHTAPFTKATVFKDDEQGVTLVKCPKRGIVWASDLPTHLQKVPPWAITL